MGIIEELTHAGQVSQYMGVAESRIQLENRVLTVDLGSRRSGSQIYVMEYAYNRGRSISVTSGIFHPKLLERFGQRSMRPLIGELDFVEFMGKLDTSDLEERSYAWSMEGRKHNIPLRLICELSHHDNLVPGLAWVISRPQHLPIRISKKDKDFAGGTFHG